MLERVGSVLWHFISTPVIIPTVSSTQSFEAPALKIPPLLLLALAVSTAWGTSSLPASESRQAAQWTKLMEWAEIGCQLVNGKEVLGMGCRSLEQPNAIKFVTESEPECFCICSRTHLLPQFFSPALYDKQEAVAICPSGEAFPLQSSRVRESCSAWRPEKKWSWSLAPASHWA